MARKIPLGVNILSILIILGAFFNIALGILLILGGFATTLSGWAAALGALLYLIGGGLIFTGLLSLIFAFALRRGKNWARWALIIVHSISAIIAIAGFNIMSIFSVAFSLVVVFYLIFSKKVKAFF